MYFHLIYLFGGKTLVLLRSDLADLEDLAHLHILAHVHLYLKQKMCIRVSVC